MDLSRFDVQKLREEFFTEDPFNHIVIDNFLEESYINSILTEIQNYPSDI